MLKKIYGHPRLLLGLIVLSLIPAGSGIRRLEVAAELVENLTDHPALEEHRRFRGWFPALEPVLIQVELPGPPGPEDLVALARIRQDLDGQPGIRRVWSPVDWLPGPARDPEGVREHLRKGRNWARFLESLEWSRILRSWFLAPSGDLLTLMVIPELAASAADRDRLLGRLRETASRAFPGRATALLGYPALESHLVDLVRISNRRFVPVAILGGLAVLWLLLGQGALVAIAGLSVLCPLLWLLGLMGWSGETLSSLSTILLPLTLSVALSNSIYILVRYGEFLEVPPVERERRVLGSILPPQFLCISTTTLGFLCLALTGVPFLARFGTWAAAGSMLTLTAAILVIPPAMRLVGTRSRAPGPGFLVPLVERVARDVTARPRRILAIGLTALALMGLGIGRLRPASSHVSSLLASDPVRRALDHRRDRFGSITTLELAWRLPGPARPEGAVLDRLRRMQEVLESDPAVAFTVSAADLILDVGSRISGRRVDGVRTQRESQLYLRYLELEAGAGAGAGALDVFAAADGRTFRTFVHLRTENAFEIVAFVERITPPLGELAGERAELFLTGMEYLTAIVHQRAVRNAIGSLLASLAGIVLVSTLFFRSPGAGFIMAVANGSPMIVTYGFMGWASVPLGVGTAIIGPLLIGMIVDDTIHFIHRFREGGGPDGDPDAGIARSIRSVGPAIVMTSITLVAGLSLSALSPFGVSRTFGLLAALTVAAGLAAELWLTPCCVRYLLGKRSGGGSR